MRKSCYLYKKNMNIKSEKTALIKELKKINDESLLRAIQSMVEYANKRDEEYLGVSIDKYNKELEEANARIERGEFVAHKEAVKRSKKWRERR